MPTGTLETDSIILPFDTRMDVDYLHDGVNTVLFSDGTSTKAHSMD